MNVEYTKPTLEQVHQRIIEHLYIEKADEDVIDFVLALSRDRMISGEPVWGYLIAPIGGTKTELLRLLNDMSDIYTLDSLTPQTLISGKVQKNPKTGDYEPVAGILTSLDGKVLIIKDFTVVLSARDEARTEIFNQLRAVYDGYYEKAFGTLSEPIRVKASMGLIAGVTPKIDKYTKTHIALGERFVKVRFRSINRAKMAEKAMMNQGKEEAIRKELGDLVSKYLNNIDYSQEVLIPEEDQNILVYLGLYTAIMRTHVWKSGSSSGTYYEASTIEVPTRLVKQYTKLMKLLALIRGKDRCDFADFLTVQRVAVDSYDPKFNEIVTYMAGRGYGEEFSANQISKEISMSRNGVFNVLRKMTALNILEEKASDTPIWYISYRYKISEYFYNIRKKSRLNPALNQFL
jgi:hypothetical protein